jgi:hypothetical protein
MTVIHLPHRGGEAGRGGRRTVILNDRRYCAEGFWYQIATVWSS